MTIIALILAVISTTALAIELINLRNSKNFGVPRPFWLFVLGLLAGYWTIILALSL